MEKQNSNAIVVAITGASGAFYALRLIKALLLADESVYVIVSKAGRLVLSMEAQLSISKNPAKAKDDFLNYFALETAKLTVFSEEDWLAPPASGSSRLKAMVIAPCTVGTLGAIASGMSNCLINRSADVFLKEKRPLILMVRETPFTTIHLKNMLTLAEAGATIMPANPGFYHEPKSIDDLFDFMVARVLDHLGVAQTLMPEWGDDMKSGLDT